MPYYGYGTTVPIYGDQYGTASGVAVYPGFVTDIPLSKEFYGSTYDLVGVICWFELGYTDQSGVWQKESEISWLDCSWGGGSCFVAGTPVVTRDGSKPIEQLTARDFILTVPLESASASANVARFEFARVTEVLKKFSPTLSLAVEGGTIGTTLNHPFYVKGKSWVAAARLKPGDLLLSADKNWVAVKAITKSGARQVYNLQVGNENFFVGGSEHGFSALVYGACENVPFRIVDNIVLTALDLRRGESKMRHQ